MPHKPRPVPDVEPYAIRNLLKKIPQLKDWLFNSNLRGILKRINPELFLSKAIFFDKSPDNNWYVTWHQDTTINVKGKTETTGYSGWTKKDDFYSVCPPDEILKDTITVRIHLDDTDEANGALKVIPGSQNKKMSNEEIQLVSQNSIPFVCDVNACGIQLMKPLLLHASSKATSQKHRRVIHLEFNSCSLPKVLEWAELSHIN